MTYKYTVMYISTVIYYLLYENRLTQITFHRFTRLLYSMILLIMLDVCLNACFSQLLQARMSVYNRKM